jgi:hypothetical protein
MRFCAFCWRSFTVSQRVRALGRSTSDNKLVTMTRPRPCPLRCFLADLPRHVPSKRLFRLMGSVVGIDCDESHADLSRISMDDGTAVVSVIALRNMVEKIRLAIGHTAECIARLDQNDVTGEQVLFVDQLVRVEDPHAESLRWMELVHRQRHPDDDMARGYPCRYITSDDIFQMISAEAMADENTGVTLEDLSVVLGMPEKEVAEMIEELQLSGQIYRNEAGAYLPL